MARTWYRRDASRERDRGLSALAVGVDALLCDASWIQGPLHLPRMQAMAQCTAKQWAGVWKEIAPAWQETDQPGWYVRPMLEAQRGEAAQAEGKAKKAAAAKWSKEQQTDDATSNARPMLGAMLVSPSSLPLPPPSPPSFPFPPITPLSDPPSAPSTHTLTPPLSSAGAGGIRAGGQADLFGQPAAGEVKQAAQVRKTRRPKPQADPAEPPKVKLADFERALEANTERWTILTGPAATSAVGAQIAISACKATLDDAAVVGRHLQATANTAQQFTSRDLARKGWLAMAIQKARAWERQGEPEARWPGQRERAPVAPISTVRETTPERAAEWARLGKMGGGQ